MTRSIAFARRAPAVAMLACAVLGLVACAALVTPQTFTEKLAAGYVTHTAVLTAATNALNASEITSADAQGLLKIATEARRVLDAAKLAHDAGDVSTAEGQLAMATDILLQLQAYLRERDHK